MFRMCVCVSDAMCPVQPSGHSYADGDADEKIDFFVKITTTATATTLANKKTVR